MIHLRRVFSTVLILSSFHFISGQKLLIPEPNTFQGRFIHYPINEPGADITTSRLFFDSKGFLWTGTFNGLYRYEGNKYTGYGFNNDPGKGLAGHFVSDIYEDSSGIMWIGTFGAINRLDQRKGEIKHFRPDSGDYLSPNNRIISIREDRSGLFWIITGDDIFTFNRKTSEFKRYLLEGLVYYWANKPGQFLEDSNGIIWIVTPGGLLRFSREEDKFIPFGKFQHGNASGEASIGVKYQISCIVEDNSGNLWYGSSGGGLNRITDPENGVFEKISLTSGINHDHRLDTIISVLPVRNGLIWIFGNGIFARYSPKTGETKSYHISPLNELYKNFRGHEMQFEDAFEDNDGSVWFLQRQGIVFRFDPITEKLRLFSVPNWIVFDWITDKQGTIWFGCANGNTWRLVLNSLPYKSTQVYNMFNVAVYDNPRIAEGKNNKIWLALSTGIFTADFNADLDFRMKQVKLPIGDTIAHCIVRDNSGNLWAGLNKNRIIKITSSDNTYKTFYLPENINNIVYKITEDSKGNLWFLTFNKIFVLYSGNDKIEGFSPDNPALKDLLNMGLYDILVDSNDNIWFAAFGNRVCSYNLRNKSITWYSSDTGTGLQQGDFCIRIKEDKRGSIWILFLSNGLFSTDQESKKLIPVRLMDHAPDRLSFSDLFIDNDNRMMVYHNYGLTLFDPNNHVTRQISYSQKPGSNSTLQLSSGQILSLSGPELKLFQDSIPFNHEVPEVYLTGLTVNDKDITAILPEASDIATLDRIELKHSFNNLKLEYASLNLLYPENNRYKYYMSGVDQDTVFLNYYHPAEYKNLRPGKYRFWFTGSNNDGVWNDVGKSIEIHITPPLSRTFLAFVFYGFLLLSLVAAFVRRHFHKLNMERKRLENEVHIRTVELEKKNQQIEQMDRMKTRFFTEISHELRTPLSLILGPIDNLMTENGRMEDSKRLGLMEMIRRNGIRLLNLVNQLLDISRIDAGKMKITLAESDLLKCLRILVNEYLSTAENRKIKFIVDISDQSYITFYDKDKIEKIVANLLSNAFKFTPAQGTVLCRVEIMKAKENGSPPVVTIKVQDTGVGISKENLDKIFDRFYRVEGQWEKDGRGTGIGLSLTEEFVTLLHGYIEVTSEKDVGSTFTVRIPVGKDHLSPDEYVVVEAHPYGIDEAEHEVFQQSMLRENELETPGRKAQILIVEDNSDLREFLRDNLNKGYHVYEAGSGWAGLNLAFSKMPDIVVTDIILPDLDGIELCKRLKNDERTSHIPIVILTAKTSPDVKIEGLTTGADDFISKPFDIVELKVRISNLLIQRIKLRHRYGLIGRETNGIYSSETVDDLFMKKVNSIISEDIRKFDFDVGVLQERLGMSRIHLYRKLKALTGLSPSSVIHYHRMKLATDLIKEKRSNLAEIALSIGYSNPSYFSRCFREFYGVSPKDFLNQTEGALKGIDKPKQD